MATYFHTNSDIQGGNDGGLQTLILMNPTSYVGFTDNHLPPPPTNFAFLNSHAPTQQFVGIPLATAGSLPPPTKDPHAPHEPHAPPVHDVAALHGFLRQHYAPYAPPTVDFAAAREGTRPQQGLSLSLSSSQAARESVPAADGGASPSVSGLSAGVNGPQSRILNSKYLAAARELLEEVVNVGRVESTKGGNNCQAKNVAGESSGAGAGEGQAGGEGSKTELTQAERQEIQMKKAKLINMLDEVEQRYRQYNHQMHIVTSWFEQAAGIGSAKTYTSLALQTISKQFRCLKDAILGQVRAASKSLGEDNNDGGVIGVKLEGSMISSSSSSRLRFVDNQLRQQRALQQLGMVQNNNSNSSVWRPQRGLPERSVSVLRAWLFEHFLHPYPKDSDKIMLAKQTGLTRSQVSNWFINARVRLWKPMVEEMYLEEIKEQEKNGSQPKTNKNEEPDEASGSASPQQQKSIDSENQQERVNKTNLIASSEMIESFTQGSPKKPRSSENVPMMNNSKPADLMKLGGESLEGPTNFMAAFGSYTMDQIGRFETEQFPTSYSGNAVSLTLGLQHNENQNQSFLHNQIGEANGFGGMNAPTFESFNIQNRKRFALPDFVT